MTGKKINILSNKTVSDEKDDLIKNYYSSWRDFNQASNASFAAIYSTFKEKHLASLDPGPLRLYLYFSFSANNKTGQSWHSIQTMAKFFNTQTRTIDNWIKALVEADLIYRERTDKLSNTTFLIPYSDTFMSLVPSKKHKENDQNLVNDLIDVVSRRKEVYGKIVKIYHLFQWRRIKTTETKEDPNHYLLIITERPNGVIVNHLYHFDKMFKYGIDELEVDGISTFKSPFKYQNEVIKGIAIDSELQIHINKNTRYIADVFNQLKNAEEDDLYHHPKVNFGLIDDFFENTEQENEELLFEDTESNENAEAKEKEGESL